MYTQDGLGAFVLLVHMWGMLLPIVCIVSAIHKEYAACDQFSFVNFLENKATCKVDLCFCVDCCPKHFWSGQPDVIPGMVRRDN